MLKISPASTLVDLIFQSRARDWKVRSTKVDAGDFKHELLNRLRSTMAVNVLTCHGSEILEMQHKFHF